MQVSWSGPQKMYEITQDRSSQGVLLSCHGNAFHVSREDRGAETVSRTVVFGSCVRGLKKIPTEQRHNRREEPFFGQ